MAVIGNGGGAAEETSRPDINPIPVLASYYQVHLLRF